MKYRWLILCPVLLAGCNPPAHAQREVDYNLLSYSYMKPAKIPAMLCLEDVQGC